MTFKMSDHSEEPMDITKLLGRGTTPKHIQQKCFDLCQQFLGGVWLNYTFDEINVKRLTGGLTNQLYYCAINEDKQIFDAKEPQEVSILFYGSKYFKDLEIDSNGRLNDTIIALLVSERGLGPKIYGLFEGGQIQKYYPHKSFRSIEQKDISLVEKVAKKLAHIHAMDVPIKKTENSLFDYFDLTYKVANQTFDIKSLIDESNSHTLKTYDIQQELEWLKEVIIDCNSPRTFTHGDFRGSNIMITESDDIVLCDFELASYGYRSFDFGTIFCEWGRNWGEWDDTHHFPDEETFKLFINSYIEESVKLKGNEFSEDIRNSFENILKEVKIFTLVGYMWVIMFLLAKNESIIPGTPFDKLQLMQPTEKIYKNAYRKVKQTLIEQHLIQDIRQK